LSINLNDLIPRIIHAKQNFICIGWAEWDIYGRRLKRAFKGETGTIKWFDPSKGYGFLIRDNGGDLFVHLRSVKPEDRRKLRENTRVKFTVEETEKGPQAENIKIIWF